MDFTATTHIQGQMSASCFDFRKKKFKCGLDADDAVSARILRGAERRSALKKAIIAENRKEKAVLETPFQNCTVVTPGAMVFEIQASQFEAWKTALKGEDESLIKQTCQHVEELVLAVCEGRVFLPESTAFKLQFLQACYNVYRLLPGGALVPVLDFFVEALQCDSQDIVRFACLTIHAAMARNGGNGVGIGSGFEVGYTSSSATEAVWMHGKNPIGLMMAAMPTQREDVQRVMMLCIILALEHHTADRLGRALPFLTAVLGIGHGNLLCLMAMDCITELAATANIEELGQLMVGGLLSFYVAIIAEADQGKAPCIENALEVIAAYAVHESPEPTAWLIAAGGLHALECLLDADWVIDDQDVVVTICTIVANIALSAPEPVLSRVSLCESVVQWVQDGDAEEEVRTEALSVLLNASIFAGGMDSVRCMALVDVGAFGAFVAAFAARRHSVKQQHILTAVSLMLDASPEQATDFEAVGGVEMLKHAVSVSFGDTAGHMAMRILKQHFPVVLGC